ncbi:hypothetical protein [Comamonas sp. lk]|uniref:hypothetical protein n=1 Tax=Comamonas sp. lk TaxID=2201272 RepID=UPI000EAEEE30|nr:hypothetical protein [Comamonas sp. lk]
MQEAIQKKPPHANSPNGCWARHGYRVERMERPMGSPMRNIYGPDGTLVLKDSDYDKEMAYCRKHGLLLPSKD